MQSNSLQILASILLFQCFAAPCIAQQNYNPDKKQLPETIPSAIQSELNFGDLPNQLDHSSAVAFNRGLMPLESRLKYLALSRDARLSQAGDSMAEREQIWNEYRNELLSIVPRIQRLGQPGARGWNAELLLAQYSVHRASQQIASMSGDHSGFDAATAALKATAVQLVRQREADYSAGLATIRDVAYAKDRLMDVYEFDSVDRIDFIENVILTQNGWNSLGAEIGRKDRIIESQLTRGLVDFQKTLQEGEISDISQSLAELSLVGHEHFQTTYGYYRNGTAPLHQLTTSIMIRQRLQRLSNDYPELKNETVDQAFHSDWNLLRSSADATYDTRGRNAADLIAIDLIGVNVEAMRDE